MIMLNFINYLKQSRCTLVPREQLLRMGYFLHFDDFGPDFVLITLAQYKLSINNGRTDQFNLRKNLNVFKKCKLPRNYPFLNDGAGKTGFSVG